MARITCPGCRNTFNAIYYAVCVALFVAAKAAGSKQEANPFRCPVCGQPK